MYLSWMNLILVIEVLQKKFRISEVALFSFDPKHKKKKLTSI